MLSAAQRFTYFTRTERRKSYCEYKGETYIKDKLAGIGRYGTSFEFISAKDPVHSVVVKRENMRMENDEETYNFGLEFEDEARYAQYFLAFGAFAGDVGDTHEPHYVLMEKVPGKVIGAQLKLTTALELLNVFDAILTALRRINEHPVLPCAHGDVRRENIMLQQDAAGNYSAKLIDFGLTNELGVMTTPMLDEILPAHIAPEVKDGTVAHSRQDILGLGSVFKKIRESSPVPYALGLDARVRTLCDNMMSNAPKNRPTHDEISTELAELRRLQTQHDEKAEMPPTEPAREATALKLR